MSASIPVAFKANGVQSNPVALTKRDRQFDSADKRPLTTDELRAYWRRIEKLPGLREQCVRLHLLTGGQRIEQLVRLRWADVRADAITIHDAKGRAGQGPRAHTVPITNGAARDLQTLERVGDFVFSTTTGVKPISGTTLSGGATSGHLDGLGPQSDKIVCRSAVARGGRQTTRSRPSMRGKCRRKAVTRMPLR